MVLNVLIFLIECLRTIVLTLLLWFRPLLFLVSASLVAYPTRGMQHSYRNDSTRFRKACIFTTLCSVKTHALSLLGTTRLLSRSDRIDPAYLLFAPMPSALIRDGFM